MGQSSLITVTKYRERPYRLLKQLIAALDTATGHDHDGVTSKSITASVTYGVAGEMAAAGTSTANAAGTTAKTARIDHAHALGTHTHAGATTGGQIGPTAFAANIFTADAAGRAPFIDGIWTTAKMAAGLLSADATGRALFAAGVLDVTTFQSAVAAGVLSATATGRAFMATDYFNAAHVATAFATGSLDATNCADIIVAGAIPGTKIDVSTFTDNSISGAKINWSYGATASTIAPDDAASAGVAATVSRSDHVHANTCAAPSAGLAAADAEGAASTFARSNHVHKATVTDAIDFTFGASDDAGLRWSTSDDDNHAAVLWLGLSKAIHITDAVTTDWNVAAYSHPTVSIHSSTTPATDYLKIHHDGTTAWISVVGGTLDLTATGEVTVNEGSADVDFRVETNNIANGFCVDAGLDAFGIGAVATNVVFANINRPARAAVASTTTWYDLSVAPGGAFTTENNTITYSVIASAYFAEPNITKGATDTITVAATVYIAGAPTEGTANHSLYVAAGTSYFAGAVSHGAGIAVNADAVDVSIGASQDVLLRWSTADADNHAFAVGLGASLAMHICRAADIATDWNVAASGHPSLFIHSSTTPATNYLQIYHSGTGLTFSGMGATNLEFRIGGANVELNISATAVNLMANSLQGGDAANNDLTLVATSHGTVLTAYIIASQMADFTTASLAVRVKAGAVGDGETGQTDLNGEVAIDSTNGRWYFRYGAAWHYCAITAGFQIPVEEKLCPICNLEIVVGDVVEGVIESILADGARHGLYCHKACVGASTGAVALPHRVVSKPVAEPTFPNAAEREAMGLRKEGDKLVPIAS